MFIEFTDNLTQVNYDTHNWGEFGGAWHRMVTSRNYTYTERAYRYGGELIDAIINDDAETILTIERFMGITVDYDKQA